METIYYIIIAVIGFIGAYVFGRFKSSSNSAAVGETRQSLDNSVDGAAKAAERQRDIINKSDEVTTGLNSAIKDVSDIDQYLERTRDRNKSNIERADELSEIVRELRRRAEQKDGSADDN